MTQDMEEKGVGKLEKRSSFLITTMICLAMLAAALIVNLLAAIFIVNLIKHLIKIVH